ncbi:glycosyltransferase family 4 protein [Robinsoniella peoriensis]
MRILYYSFSCAPCAGSDEGLGWLWPFYMRNDHEVYVVTRKDRKPQIERYLKDQNITNMRFFYCDIPDWMNFYYKTGKGFLAYQKLWQYPAYGMIKKLHKKYQFDLIHHVSTTDFRLIGFVYKLDTHYILGPLGGAQQTPAYLRDYTKNNSREEKMRALINRLTISNPGYQKAINKADYIFLANKETYQYIYPYIKEKERCRLLLDIAIDKSKISPGEDTGRQKTDWKTDSIADQDKVMTFIWSGRMVYRKGLELLLDALDCIDRKLPYKVVLCGEGPEMEHLKELSREKRLEGHISFTGQLTYEKMQENYDNADVFVFPSLRETSGTVLVEAMAHGLPVIALNQGGAALLISEKDGFLVSGGNRKDYVIRMAEIIEECIRKPEIVRKKGLAASKKVFNDYTWERKISFMNGIYNELRF